MWTVQDGALPVSPTDLAQTAGDGGKLSVTALLVDHQNALWIGTAGEGLYRLYGEKVSRYGTREGLPNDTVEGLFEDHEGTLWVLTARGIRLVGHDTDWADAGTRRQAFYTDLPPGDYRFQVIGSNNDGVWNESGATLDFSITPAFYQTRWFDALCITAAAGVLWLLYLVRVRQIEMRIRMRIEERVIERERIARDLHDTLLQSVQGLILRFQAVLARIPEGGERPLQMMEQALERADQVLAEGREQGYDLRKSTQAV